MWHFTTLDKAQKLERRHVLDTYGAIAQASCLVPIFALQIYFLVVWLQRKWRSKAELEAPGSPYLKKAKAASASSSSYPWQSIGGLEKIWRRTSWWASGKIEVLGFEATRGEMGFAGIWTAWLLALSVVQTNGGTFQGSPFSFIAS